MIRFSAYPSPPHGLCYASSPRNPLRQQVPLHSDDSLSISVPLFPVLLSRKSSWPPWSLLCIPQTCFLSTLCCHYLLNIYNMVLSFSAPLWVSLSGYNALWKQRPRFLSILTWSPSNHPCVWCNFGLKKFLLINDWGMEGINGVYLSWSCFVCRWSHIFFKTAFHNEMLQRSKLINRGKWYEQLKYIRWWNLTDSRESIKVSYFSQFMFPGSWDSAPHHFPCWV